MEPLTARLREHLRGSAACWRAGVDRRTLLRLTGLAGLSWLTPVAERLARAADDAPRGEPAQSLIFLWLAGGPSQLETFDPHPGSPIGGPTRTIQTAASGVELAEGFAQLAEQMADVALVRSLVSKEGDHERGTYMVKTGYRPDPTVVHPSIGAICCHQLPVGGTEIPRHVSILPDAWPGRGGLLGAQYDAFRCYDPQNKVPDILPRVAEERYAQRLADLDVLESAFAAGRRLRVRQTLHQELIRDARTMMTSDQLRAFEIDDEPRELRAAYGDTPFGRGCLAARRLIEVGVRCVEVTLGGWDTHADNFELTRANVQTLDPAFAMLLRDLRERGLLEKTVVLCGGEFGRTPQINRLDGRDHWPTGFSLAAAGGGIRGGQVLGATDPTGASKDPSDPVEVADLHATVLTALGIDPAHEEISAVGRPIKFSEGRVLGQLLAHA